MKYVLAMCIHELKQFGEFGSVDPSNTDSSTYTFLHAQNMEYIFHGHAEGCFLYSRHWNPTNKYLADVLAAMENTESACVTSSGMAAIICVLLQLCKSGDQVITRVTTYGGTCAFCENWLPRCNIEVSFVNISDIESIRKAIQPNTKVIYTASVTNPLLQVSNVPVIAKLVHSNGNQLMVDNTFSPIIFSPKELGADVVVSGMTKFINGKNDCVAGAICVSNQFVDDLLNVNDGTAMLLGLILDPIRSSSILKNLNTLHIRMQQHSENTLYLAQQIEVEGLIVCYPGLKTHSDYEMHTALMNKDFGYEGIFPIDLKTVGIAEEFMQGVQYKGVGYLAVSLGYFKTLFSLLGKSTSSEISTDVQKEMGLSEGLVRFSVGLDHNIEKTFELIKQVLEELKLI